MAKVIGKEINNLPWEECPKGCDAPFWRYSGNPVIDRHPNKIIARAFNSALVAYQGEFIGVFRGDKNDDTPNLFVGHSKDGIHFEFEEKPIHFVDRQGNPVPDTEYQYDPRVIPLEDRFYIVWCDDFGGPTISIAETKDFKTFVKIDTPFLPYNRNGVMFPRKVNDKYLMLSRPTDLDKSAFGSIYLSESKDLEYWGHHRLVARQGGEWWCSWKIGAGPAPIETDEGWILFFHGANNTCNGLVYSVGAMLLDREDPSKVLYRCKNFVLAPEEGYEVYGFVPNVIFPTCALADAKTGRIALYYGSADTFTGLAFTTVDRLVKYIKENARERK